MHAYHILDYAVWRKLSEAGFVVVHSLPTDDMIKAGCNGAQDRDGSVTGVWHRMVAASLHAQIEAHSNEKFS